MGSCMSRSPIQITITHHAANRTKPNSISLRCSGCRQIKKASWFTRDEQRKSIKMCYKCMTAKQSKADDINDKRTLKWQQEARRHKKVSMTKQEFFTMLAKMYQGPDAIACIIFECMRSRSQYIPFYRPQDLRPKSDARIWPANYKHMYGVSFKPTWDILCWGIQIFANFGKVRTHCVVGLCENRGLGCNQTWKAH